MYLLIHKILVLCFVPKVWFRIQMAVGFTLTLFQVNSNFVMAKQMLQAVFALSVPN